MSGKFAQYAILFGVTVAGVITAQCVIQWYNKSKIAVPKTTTTTTPAAAK